MDDKDDPDTTLKCYIKCVMLEFKTMDEDGRLDPSPAIELLSKSERWIQKIMFDMGKKCVRAKYPKGIDLCERAFLIHKCFKETDPVVIDIFYFYFIKKTKHFKS